MEQFPVTPAPSPPPRVSPSPALTRLSERAIAKKRGSRGAASQRSIMDFLGTMADGRTFCYNRSELCSKVRVSAQDVSRTRRQNDVPAANFITTLSHSLRAFAPSK